MIEDKSINELQPKEPWVSPDLLQLNFNKTLGGPTPANYEDTYNNNPTSE